MTSTMQKPNSNRNGRTGMSVETPEKEKETRGRKVTCKADLGNGATCELYKDHADTNGKPTPHQAIDLTEQDLALEFMPADEIQNIVRSVAERSPAQKAVDANIHAVHAEWVKQGSKSDAPVWAALTVAPHKAPKMRRMLRNGADFHAPPVQLKTGGDRFVSEGKHKGMVRIPYAVMDRRKYTKATEKTEATK
ncbi:MAG: hypothetical protein ACREBW_03175 [Candidatus Micrarchaeaceae archaeon]